MSQALLKPMLLAFGGFTLWTIGDALIRLLNDYSPFQIAFITSCFALVFLFALSPVLGGVKRSFAMPKMGLQIGRGLLLAIPSFLSFIVFANLELATAYAILFVVPVMAKIFSVILNKESISPRMWMITLLGFVGVLIILRPGVIPLNIGTISALSMTVLFAFGHVLTRYIGEENQTLFGMAFYKTLFVWLATAVPAYFVFQSVPMLDLALMAFMGLEGALGTILVSRAFATAPAAYVAPIHYTQIIWGVIWGALLFAEFPDAYTMVGASVIIASGLLLLKYSR